MILLLCECLSVQPLVLSGKVLCELPENVLVLSHEGLVAIKTHIKDDVIVEITGSLEIEEQGWFLVRLELPFLRIEVLFLL